MLPVDIKKLEIDDRVVITDTGEVGWVSKIYLDDNVVDVTVQLDHGTDTIDMDPDDLELV
jgi:hypothetical protein